MRWSVTSQMPLPTAPVAHSHVVAPLRTAPLLPATLLLQTTPALAHLAAQHQGTAHAMQCVAGIELFKYLPTNSSGSGESGGSSSSALGEVSVELKGLELADLGPNAMMQAVLQGTRLDVGVFWEKYERTCRAWLDNRQPAWVKTAAAAPPPMRRMIETVRQAAKQAAQLRVRGAADAGAADMGGDVGSAGRSGGPMTRQRLRSEQSAVPRSLLAHAVASAADRALRCRFVSTDKADKGAYSSKGRKSGRLQQQSGVLTEGAATAEAAASQKEAGSDGGDGTVARDKGGVLLGKAAPAGAHHGSGVIGLKQEEAKNGHEEQEQEGEEEFGEDEVWGEFDEDEECEGFYEDEECEESDEDEEWDEVEQDEEGESGEDEQQQDGEVGQQQPRQQEEQEDREEEQEQNVAEKETNSQHKRDGEGRQQLTEAADAASMPVVNGEALGVVVLDAVARCGHPSTQLPANASIPSQATASDGQQMLTTDRAAAVKRQLFQPTVLGAGAVGTAESPWDSHLRFARDVVIASDAVEAGGATADTSGPHVPQHGVSGQQESARGKRNEASQGGADRVANTGKRKLCDSQDGSGSQESARRRKEAKVGAVTIALPGVCGVHVWARPREGVVRAGAATV